MTIYKILAAWLILTWLLTPAFADSPGTPDSEPETYWTLRMKGKYLASLAMMEKEFEQSRGDYENSMKMVSQIAQFYPILGDVKCALRWDDMELLSGSSIRLVRTAFGNAWNRSDSKTRSEVKVGTCQAVKKKLALDKAGRRDALDAIIDAAKTRQIVILNEAHHLSQNRAFGMQVALALRELHFDYFAAETFGNKITEAAGKGYIARDMGYYTEDPVFGDFVRQVLRAGYRLIPYESDWQSPSGDSWDQINAREIQQAQHLADRILKKDPAAKILVYVGYAHATKNWRLLPDGREAGWMAARLRRETGIDPLCIDQTAMTEHSAPRFEQEVYRHADSKGWLDTPAVFEETPSHFWTGGSYANKVDMQVFHPRTKLINGRPDWLRLGGYRRPFALKDAWLPSAGRCLLQAFVESEPNDAIAMDQIVITEKSRDGCLLLPSGVYRIMIQDEEGRSRKIDTITQP